jgi:hypothetical protein
VEGLATYHFRDRPTSLLELHLKSIESPHPIFGSSICPDVIAVDVGMPAFIRAIICWCKRSAHRQWLDE